MQAHSHNTETGQGHEVDVTVVIPHYAGSQLLECLEAVYSCADKPCELIVVDDASVEDYARQATTRFPGIVSVRNAANLGFVGACNRGLELATSTYTVLLNDDTLVEAGWLDALVRTMDQDPTIGAAQPKIVRADDPSRFDYAGAAGGLIDRYGYPFALGRWFDTCERDDGQYDSPRPVFWASGTAMCMRMAVCGMIGPLETMFQMHMEEIDWCWRCYLAGFEVTNVPNAKVRHYGALTLKAESYRKMYLNHRNSILMLLKNYSIGSLVTVLPIRVLLETITVIGAVLTGNWRRSCAALFGTLAAVTSPRRLLQARKKAQSIRRRSDKEISEHMYGGSIALRHVFRLDSPATLERSGECSSMSGGD